MHHIVECSSIYSIDLSAILFSSVLNPQISINIYINDKADVKTEFRRFLHKLSIPTFDWAIDPNGQLRQIHIPIDNICKDEFLLSCVQAFNTYGKKLNIKNVKSWKHINQLILNLENFLSEDSIENYMELIRQIFLILGIKNISVKKYSLYKYELLNKNKNAFLLNLNNTTNKMLSGDYKFHKGGSIEAKINSKDIIIKHVCVSNNETVFKSINNEQFSLYDLNKMEMCFKGPLETYFLAEDGLLLHLPWYGKADYSFEKGRCKKGIEYITPVTVASLNRVSKEFSGLGYRLNPSGYSLIEYDHENVLKLLNCLYEENVKVTFDDLADWKYMINNFPYCSQKAAKTQNRAGEFVRVHFMNEYKKMINSHGINKFSQLNFTNLGINLIHLLCGLRISREYLHEKSPYFLNKDHLAKFMNKKAYDKEYIINISNELFKKLFDFVSFFYKSQNDELNKIKEKYDKIIMSMESTNENMDCVKLLSGLEQLLVKFAGIYYETALFITCVILKANIFTSFIVLGDDYLNCVSKIINQRSNKLMYFSPKFF